MAAVGILVWLGALVGVLALSRKSGELADGLPPDRADYRGRIIRWIRLHGFKLFVVLSLFLLAIVLFTSGDTNCGASCD